MDILFIIGLPRSGTSLVHKLVHESTDRKAPTFRDFGISLHGIPRRVRELNKTLHDASSLAEDNDFPYTRYGEGGDLHTYRRYLETRGSRWVCKSPDHLGQLPELLEVFPESRFLWCIRPAGATLASIREYYQVTGLGPVYKPVTAVGEAYYIAKALPEKFDCVYTPSIPEFESDRQKIDSPEADKIDQLQSQLGGFCRRVSSRDFKELYS